MEMNSSSVHEAIDQHIENRKRDWVALLAPTAVALVVSLLIQVCGGVWFASAVANRVANLEVRATHIEGDYMPKEQIKEAADREKEERQAERETLRTIQLQLNQIQQNQMEIMRSAK